MKTLLFTFLLIFLSPALVFGQEWEHPYFSYTKENGLPSNLVYGSLIDKDGLLWICTDGGVVLFDGSNSRVFTTLDGLPSNDVYHMFCDSKNRIWFTTLKNEVSYYFNGKIHNSHNDDVLAGIKTKATFPIYYEIGGKVWIFYKTDEIYVYYNDTINLKNLSNNTSHNNLLFKSNDRLYFSNEDSIRYFDLKNEEFHFSHPKNRKITNGLLQINNSIYCINDSNKNIECWPVSILLNTVVLNASKSNYLFQDSNRIYSTINNTLLEINTSDGKSRVLTRDKSISSVFGAKKLIWLSSFNKGLIGLLTSECRNIYEMPKIISSPSSIIKKGENFFCGYTNGGVGIINLKPFLHQQPFTITDRSPLNPRILKILMIKDHIYSISTNLILDYNIEQSSYIKFSVPFSLKNIYYDIDHFVILTNLGVQFASELNSNLIRHFYNNKRAYSFCRYKGRRMIGTQDSLMVIDNTYHPFPLLNSFSARIMDLQTEDSLLYAATAENGVYIINDFQVIRNINTSNGLSSNNCYKIKLYKGNIYVATDNGISIVDGKNYSIQHIYESDGLPSGTINDMLIENDTLYAATEAGLSLIPLSKVNLNKEYQLIAKPFAVGSDTSWEIPHKVIAYSKDPLYLIFHGLSFIKNTNKKYFVRISGKDSSFILTLDKAYSFLIKHPGKYMFEAYVHNSENSPSLLLRFPIIIAPLFYQTLWFKAILLILLSSTIYITYAWLDNRLKVKDVDKAKQEDKLRSLEYTAWKSSVNPHFLFNSLNTMQSMYQGKDFNRANEYLRSFSGILRKTVDLSGKLFIRIEDEVDYLTSYLTFEQIKHKQSFQFEINYDQKEIGHFYIPSLVIQPVIENSIKHAFVHSSEGFLRISLHKTEHKIICCIQDNGPGITDSSIQIDKSKGIQLIKSKLNIIEAITKETIIFLYSNVDKDSNNPNKGFQTTFTFPLLTATYDQNNYN